MAQRVSSRRRVPVWLQLYACLDDDDDASPRDSCTQFVMDASKDTLEDAIAFLSTRIAPELWGISRVKLVGVVPLVQWENKSVKPRKVICSFPLERLFAPGHQDCLVVTSGSRQRYESAAQIVIRDFPTLQDEMGALEAESAHDVTDTKANSNGKDIATPATLALPKAFEETYKQNEDGERHAVTGKALTSVTDEETDDNKQMASRGEAESDEVVTVEESKVDATTMSDGANEDSVIWAVVPPVLEDCSDGDVNMQSTAAKPANATPDAEEKNIPSETEDGNIICAVVPPVLEDYLGDDAAMNTTKEGAAKATPAAEEKHFPNGTDAGEEEHFSVRKAIEALERKASPPKTEDEKRDKIMYEALHDTWDDERAFVEAKESASSSQEARTKDTVISPYNFVEELSTSTSDGNSRSSGRLPTKSDHVVAAASATAICDHTTSETTRPCQTAEKEGILGINKNDKENEMENATFASVRDDATENFEDDVGPIYGCLPDYLAKDIAPKGGGEETVSSSQTDIQSTDAVVATQSVTDSLPELSTPSNQSGVVDTTDAVLASRSADDFSEEGDEVATTEQHVTVKEIKMPNLRASERAGRDATDENSFKPEIPRVFYSQAMSKGERISAYDLTGDHSRIPVELASFDDEVPATASFDNVVVVDLPGRETKGTAAKIDEETPAATGYGVVAEPLDDSWDTQPDLVESSTSFFASAIPPAQSKSGAQQNQDVDGTMTLPSLLGGSFPAEWEDADDSDFAPILDGTAHRGGGAHHEGDSKPSAADISYKIGSTYFLLRERDGIEYPVKILSLGRRGTCIVAYENHRAKKKVRTSSLLRDTPERRRKFEELTKNNDDIANDLPALISNEAKLAQTEIHARNDDRKKYGHHISRENIPQCLTEGALFEFPSRRVYFAIDRETVKDIGKKFNVPSDRIVFDNKPAYPSLKKSSQLRPLTSIVLPPV